MTIHLYADGGVIKRNPSAIGGTWAWRRVHDGGDYQGANPYIWGESGIITPSQAGLPEITNNLTEMLALLYGLQRLLRSAGSPDTQPLHIYSDSQVTLGRIFLGWKWKNIPGWVHDLYQEQRSRLTHWDRFGFTLLDGHPTKAQLAAGIGKRGHPVSIHNVWCDEACREQAERFLASHGAQP